MEFKNQSSKKSLLIVINQQFYQRDPHKKTLLNLVASLAFQVAIRSSLKMSDSPNLHLVLISKFLKGIIKSYLKVIHLSIMLWKEADQMLNWTQAFKTTSLANLSYSKKAAIWCLAINQRCSSNLISSAIGMCHLILLHLDHHLCPRTVNTWLLKIIDLKHPCLSKDTKSSTNLTFHSIDWLIK